MLRKSIYKIGEAIRSPEIKKKYQSLKVSEKWTKEELENYQVEEMKKILNQAYNKSYFYKKLYDDNNFNPEDFQKLEDLNKIPVINKQDLLDNIESIQNKDGYRKLYFSETSGSTGEPLGFYRDSDWDAGHRAAQLRGYSWYNVQPWEKNGYFWGYNFKAKNKFKIRLLDLLLNRFRLFTYDDKEIDAFLKKLKKARYIEGYSSMIYEVAKKMNEKNIIIDELKMVKGTSEKIFESYQVEINKAFGQKMVSEYGAMETGIIAFECPKGNMHITMENVIVEENNGEALVTNLLSNSFPIIRYNIGDKILLNRDESCKCGMNHDIIDDVLGRIGQSIIGKKNNYPSLTLYYIFKNILLEYGEVVNYQAIQKKLGN